MSLNDNSNRSRGRTVSRSEIIVSVVAVAVLFVMLSIKQIVPTDPFIIKYFTGDYVILGFTIYVIIIYIYGIIFSRRKRSK